MEAAARANIRCFIHMNSVGAITGNISNDDLTDQTNALPQTDFGRSQLEADHMLADLMGGHWSWFSLRPPLIVGARAKGNRRSLQKLSTCNNRVRVADKGVICGLGGHFGAVARVLISFGPLFGGISRFRADTSHDRSLFMED